MRVAQRYETKLQFIRFLGTWPAGRRAAHTDHASPMAKRLFCRPLTPFQKSVDSPPRCNLITRPAFDSAPPAQRATEVCHFVKEEKSCFAPASAARIPVTPTRESAPDSQSSRWPQR